jgi:hypothetical protein
MTGKRTLVALLLLIIVPGIHGFALAQHSASVSETVRFVVLPVHTGASGPVTPSAISVNETVSAERISVGIIPPSGQSTTHMLSTPGSLLLRPRRGSSVIITITG